MTKSAGHSISHIPYARNFKCVLIVLIFGPTLHWINHNCLCIYHYYKVLKTSETLWCHLKKSKDHHIALCPSHFSKKNNVNIFINKSICQNQNLMEHRKTPKSLFESLSFTLKQLELTWATLRRDRNKEYYHNLEGACVEYFTRHDTCSIFVWTSVAMSHVNFQVRNISQEGTQLNIHHSYDTM